MRWAAIVFLPIVDTASCSCLKLPSEESAGLFSVAPFTTGNSLLPLAKYVCAEGLARYSRNAIALALFGAFFATPPPAMLKTAAGGTLTTTASGKTVSVTDESGGISKVTIADVNQSNGVIHVVDKVLLPK